MRILVIFPIFVSASRLRIDSFDSVKSETLYENCDILGASREEEALALSTIREFKSELSPKRAPALAAAPQASLSVPVISVALNAVEIPIVGLMLGSEYLSCCFEHWACDFKHWWGQPLHGCKGSSTIL